MPSHQYKHWPFPFTQNLYSTPKYPPSSDLYAAQSSMHPLYLYPSILSTPLSDGTGIVLLPNLLVVFILHTITILLTISFLAKLTSWEKVSKPAIVASFPYADNGQITSIPYTSSCCFRVLGNGWPSSVSLIMGEKSEYEVAGVTNGRPLDGLAYSGWGGEGRGKS